MRFHMLDKTVQELMKICIDNDSKLSGTMIFKNVDGEYYFKKYVLNDSDSRENNLCFNNIDEPVIVKFYTNPDSNALAFPSDRDKSNIEELQKYICDTDGRKCIFVQCIITRNEIGFYYYGASCIKRIQLFTESGEVVPTVPKSKSFLRVFKSWGNKENRK